MPCNGPSSEKNLCWVETRMKATGGFNNSYATIAVTKENRKAVNTSRQSEAGSPCSTMIRTVIQVSKLAIGAQSSACRLLRQLMQWARLSTVCYLRVGTALGVNLVLTY